MACSHLDRRPIRSLLLGVAAVALVPALFVAAAALAQRLIGDGAF